MTENTKELFDASWTVITYGETLFELSDSNNKAVCVCNKREVINRLARLPELYDALAEATRRYCGICHNLSGQDEPKIEDLIKNGCPAHAVSCVALDWLELLRKVRDGK